MLVFAVGLGLPGAAQAQAPSAPPATSLEMPSLAQPVEQPPHAEPRSAVSPRAEPPPAPPSPVEVTVRGATNEGVKLRRSAESVNVVSTRKAQQQSADLGEVLARTQGVAVRRDAGLGSSSRFSLDGLYGDQIRFFLDGVPLTVAGFPFGLANVPVNLMDRVDIYRGVVPVRFGADALGGAVNLISADRPGTHAAASYQIGSFSTHRLTAFGKLQDARTGLFAGASGFFDYARNNYAIDVQTPDDSGRLQDARVTRFHDGYRAFGASLETGVTGRAWAERLSLRGYFTGYDKDLQSNAVMTVPYGEVTYGERVAGITARYLEPLSHGLHLDLVASYARREITLLDVSYRVYDWYGIPGRKRQIRGEIDSADRAHDDIQWQSDVYARALLSWALAPSNALRLSLSPAYTDRVGQNRAITSPSTRDPLASPKERLSFISGLEWELNAFGDRLQNISFVKSYLFHAAYEEALLGGGTQPLARDLTTFGAGDALRLRLSPWLILKASYEYATRLPSTDELFGNGVLIAPNLKLNPEVSHGANLGPRAELRRTPIGDITFDVNGFFRESQDLIVLLGAQQYLTYQNVYAARSLGVEGALAWSSPDHLLNLDGTITYQDLRNVSSEGTFGSFASDRIPNRPWLFASFGARVDLPRLPERIDGALEAFYVGRYVHSFFRGWESAGLPEFKQTIPAQLSHDIGLTYAYHAGPGRLAATFEIDNLADARLYDSFGAQRPGRAVYLKLTGEL